ncbi:MAG: tRNA pseudouridine(38-40) synthase TruA, partial [Clostridia bacterium]|nr:tRNA pseudouridine(38-40) synthase TruA [Clostridia bacterium]
YAASLFEGEHDFKAYCKSGSQVKTTVRTVYSVKVQTQAVDGVTSVDIFVEGNGFLYNMVRTLVGTLINFAEGALTEEEIIRSLSEGDREAVGRTMPAKGLTLEKVEYGFELFK